jgi:large repetitive protein
VSATLQATVSPADATGSVRFYQGSFLLGSATLNNAVATFPWTSSAGSYPLHAVYGGDPTHNLSSSNTVTLTIQKGNTTTAIGSNLNPSVQGQTVTFTATVTPSDATEGVLFYNGGTLLGSAALSGGVATFTISTLPNGSNAISASYAGNGAYNGSTSPPLTQVVKATTTISLASTPNPSTFGSPVTLTATVTPASATGSVQFFNGSALLGTANLTSGSAQLTVTGLPAGTDSLTASYGGDAANAPSASSARLQTVNKANSTTTLSASPASQSTSGQTVTFTAKVAPSTGTGVVQFLDGSTLIGSAALSNGTAVFATTKLAVGTHSIKASYGGDSNVNGSQSGALSYRVKH